MAEYPDNRVEWAVMQLERGESVDIHSEEEYRQVKALARKRGVPFNVGGSSPQSAHLSPDQGEEGE